MPDEPTPEEPRPDPAAPDEMRHIRSRFDEIVEGLDLELPDDLEAPRRPPPTPRRPAPVVPAELDDHVDFDDLPDEPFYRDVGPVGLPPMSWPTTVAWVALAGVPLLLVVCTLVGVFLPRGLLAAAALTSVAGAIWLISRLPSRGRPDSPDGGAVL